MTEFIVIHCNLADSLCTILVLSLQNEVTMLRNEVSQLKQLLLAHKDCPVTALQRSGQGYLCTYSIKCSTDPSAID